MSTENQSIMDELIHARRSVRAFTSEPVPEDIINEIFQVAGSAPSNCNTQPWSVHVVQNDAARQMSQALLDSIGAGQFQMDFPYDDSHYTGVVKERQREAARLLYSAADIDRDDKAKRYEFFMDNIRFYGAPQAAFFFMPDWCGVREASDMGMFAQTLLLAMRARNIGSCAQTILGFNADVVRKQLGLDKSMKLLFGVSFGYYDSEAPINTVRTPRADVSDYVTIHA